jgi:uncharacterized protein (TIGR02453 family)
MEFNGFGRGSQKFFADLAANNTRAWFPQNQERYEREILAPAAAFVQALGPRLAKIYPSLHFGTARNGSESIMRIHRDVRFSADKSPYKLNLGVVFWIGSGKKVELPCLYLGIEADSAFFYGGQHTFPGPVLQGFRAAVDDDTEGTALVKTLKSLEKKGLRVLEEPAYKKVPTGYPADHPRALLLRHDGIGVSRSLGASELRSPGLVDLCAGFAATVRPLLDWLSALNT